MFTNITRTTLCITAFSIASLMAAPLNATKTESLDWNWKYATGTGKSHGIRHCHQ